MPKRSKTSQLAIEPAAKRPVREDSDVSIATTEEYIPSSQEVAEREEVSSPLATEEPKRTPPIGIAIMTPERVSRPEPISVSGTASPSQASPRKPRAKEDELASTYSVERIRTLYHTATLEVFNVEAKKATTYHASRENYDIIDYILLLTRYKAVQMEAMLAYRELSAFASRVEGDSRNMEIPSEIIQYAQEIEGSVIFVNPAVTDKIDPDADIGNIATFHRRFANHTRRLTKYKKIMMKAHAPNLYEDYQRLCMLYTRTYCVSIDALLHPHEKSRIQQTQGRGMFSGGGSPQSALERIRAFVRRINSDRLRKVLVLVVKFKDDLASIPLAYRDDFWRIANETVKYIT